MFDLEDFPLLDAWKKWLLILKWNVFVGFCLYLHTPQPCMQIKQQPSKIPLGWAKQAPRTALHSFRNALGENTNDKYLSCLKKPGKVIIIIYTEKKFETGMWLIWEKELGGDLLLWIKCPQNCKTSVKETWGISRGCIHLVNWKQRTPNCSGRSCIWRQHRGTLGVSTQATRATLGDSSKDRRGIRSSPLMGLTHQTLLTSTNEWNLRFSHGLNLSGEANLKSERASGLQLPSISQSPADSLQQPGCLWAVREWVVGRGKEERGGEPGILCSTHPWAPSSNVPCEWAHCVTASDCSWTGRWGRGPSLSPLGYRPPRNPGWNGESCKQWHTAFPKWSGHHLK